MSFEDSCGSTLALYSVAANLSKRAVKFQVDPSAIQEHLHVSILIRTSKPLQESFIWLYQTMSTPPVNLNEVSMPPNHCD